MKKTLLVLVLIVVTSLFFTAVAHAGDPTKKELVSDYATLGSGGGTTWTTVLEVPEGVVLTDLWFDRTHTCDLRLNLYDSEPPGADVTLQIKFGHAGDFQSMHFQSGIPSNGHLHLEGRTDPYSDSSDQCLFNMGWSGYYQK